jgi:hypothetical protein
MLRLLALVAPFLLAGCTVFGVRTVAEPPFEVVDRPVEGIELRRYGERVAAEVRLGPEAGESAAFRLLFDYISGANEAAGEIAMTAPVERANAKIAMTAPVEMGRGDDAFVMRFFLPAGYTLETAPRPTNPNVTLVALDEALVAVTGFSGWWTRGGIARRQTALVERLADTAWRPAGPAIAWFYDPPWTLPFFRRNEIAVPVVERDAAAQPPGVTARPVASDS